MTSLSPVSSDRDSTLQWWTQLNTRYADLQLSPTYLPEPELTQPAGQQGHAVCAHLPGGLYQWAAHQRPQTDQGNLGRKC